MPYRPPPIDQTDPTLPGIALDVWMQLNGVSAAEFARLVPCSKPYPGVIARGQQQPSYRMACRIEEITGGAVPRTRWYPAGAEPKATGVEDLDIDYD